MALPGRGSWILSNPAQPALAPRDTFFAPGTFSPRTAGRFLWWLVQPTGVDIRGRVPALGMLFIAGALIHGTILNKYGPDTQLHGRGHTIAAMVGGILIAVVYLLWLEITTARNRRAAAGRSEPPGLSGR